MSRWTDPTVRQLARGEGFIANSGMARALRQIKRWEAEDRNAQTPSDRRKASRRKAQDGAA